MRRALLTSILLVLATLVRAAAPPPVPALPDTERRTAYSITGTTCNCAVNFALYGDNTDYQDWIEVYLNGILVNYNDPVFGWKITSPTGTLGGIPLPITDAILNFNFGQTGTVQIVGARRPRRVTEFNENAGVPARSLNQAFNDLTAMQRETWDKLNDVTGRALISQPGNTVGMLPLPSQCVSSFLAWDATGLKPICLSITSVTTGVVGPGSTTPGDMAVWNSSNGSILGDGPLGSGVATALAHGVGTVGGFILYGSAQICPTNAICANNLACNGVADDTANLQADVALAAGKTIYLPSGVCMISSTVTSSAPILVMGQGAGSGPGPVSSSATVIESTSGFTTGPMFVCSTIYECYFEHIQFNAAVQRTTGAAIQITSGSSSSYATYSLVHDVAFNNQYISVETDYQGLFEMDHTYHALTNANRGWYSIGSAIVESAAKIHDNYMSDLGPGTPVACMDIHHGYVDIYANVMSGCQVGINLICDIHDCGSEKLEHNVIENQTLDPIFITATNGHNVAMIDIADNEFSGSFPATLQAAMVNITAFAGGGQLATVTIHGNQADTPMSNTSGISCIAISQPLTTYSGMIDHNVCNNISGSTTFAFGITLANSVVGYALVDNMFAGILATQRYSIGTSAAPYVVDHFGLPALNLPAAFNGSEIFATDGAPASSPCTGTSTGSMAMRQNGAWKCF